MKKQLLKFHIMCFLELSGIVGLRSKARRMLRSLLVCLLFSYWFKPKSSVIRHESGRGARCGVTAGRRQSCVALHHKAWTKYHTFVCLPKNWGENQLKGENHICQARGRRGPLFCLCCRPPKRRSRDEHGLLRSSLRHQTILPRFSFV